MVKLGESLFQQFCRGEPYVRPRTKFVCEQVFVGEYKVRAYIKQYRSKLMSQSQKIILTIILLFFINSIALSKDINTLLSFSHVENQTSNTTTINVEWTASTIEGDKIYAAFSKGMTFVFSDESYDYDPSEPENVPNQVILPVQQLNHTADNTSHTVDTDSNYYFNIVIDSDGEYGSTKSIGPFIIDTTEPSPVNIYGVTSTNSTSIELTLEPADADQVCVLLNTTNTASCNWEDIPESRKLISPTLSEGDNQIYGFFKDIAGNTNQANHNVNCTIDSNNSEQKSEKLVNVPIFSIWGQILFMGIILFSAVFSKVISGKEFTS